MSADASIPLRWSDNEKLAWAAAIPGAGWSQPVILGPHVFVTSAVSDQPGRPKDYTGGTSDPYTMDGGKATAPEIAVDWKVFALDLQTGTVRWERTVVSGKPKYPIHPSNTYASETPAADQRGVYVLFGAAGMAAGFAHQGQLLWKRDLGVSRQLQNYGTASSPRLYQGLLYFQCFSEDQAFVVCLDTKDGHERWRVARQHAGSSWTTPLIWRQEPRAELVICGQKLLSSHEPLTGRELWRIEGIEMPSAASASSDDQRLYFGCRDPLKGGPLHALNGGAQGDQSAGPGEKTFKNEAWRAADAAPGMPSPLAVDGCVYTLNESLLYCIDASTGRQHFKVRLPGFRAVVASPIAVGGKVVIIDESGKAIVLQAGPKFELLGQSKLSDSFWASPATAGGALLLRGVDRIYCIRD